MKVSILIPTYNRAMKLRKAIESALNQDYDNLEVVVTDNNSTDNTFKIISDFLSDNRLKYYKNDINIGSTANIRKGIFNYITGDYYVILSDDDYLINDNFISQAVELIKNNENVLAVSSYGYFYKEESDKCCKVIPPFSNVENGKKIFMNYMKVRYLSNNTLLNRKFSIEMNAFSNPDNKAMDLEIFLNHCLFGDIGLIKEFSNVYALHSQSESKIILKNYNFLMGWVESVINPYDLALKYDKLNNNEKKHWEDFVLMTYFKQRIAHVLFYFPDRYDDAIEFLSSKNSKVLKKALKTKKLRVAYFLNRIHLFRPIYKILMWLWDYQIKNTCESDSGYYNRLYKFLWS